jgi:hypothetical protein
MHGEIISPHASRDRVLILTHCYVIFSMGFGFALVRRV